MTTLRSIAAAALAVLAAGALSPVLAQSQERYPARAVTIIFPYATGGSDAMARGFAEALSRVMSQQFVVVNRDGAAGRIGMEQLANAKPDGYTLGFSPTTPMTNLPHLQKGVPYTIDSFEYVCQVFENIFTVSVAQGSPFKTLTELVDFARANPGRLSFGHAGLGTGPHLMVEGFARGAGIKVQQIPYRGDGQMLPALIGAQIDFGAPGVSSIAARNDVRVLSVFADQRHPAYPGVPTVTELGLPNMPPGYQGMYAPKGSPPEIMRALETGCREATQAESFRALATRLFQPIVFMTGADFKRRTQADFKLKEELIKALALKLD